MNPRKNDFERAVSLLHRDGYTCVLCDRDRVLTSREHGLAPLIRLLDTNESLQDMAVADHLIGRAAALLLLAAGVKAVYGEVMSEEAHRLLSDAGVRTEYGTLVPKILNRAGTAPLPDGEGRRGRDRSGRSPARPAAGSAGAAEAIKQKSNGAGTCSPAPVFYRAAARAL